MDEERKNILLTEIREKRDGRTDRKTVEPVQDEFRLVERIIDEASGRTNGSDEKNGGGASEIEGNERIVTGDDRKSGRIDNPADEGNGSISTGDSTNDQSTQSATSVKKPKGIHVIPSTKERIVRTEEEKRKANAERQKRFREKQKANKPSDPIQLVSDSSEDTPKRSLVDAIPLPFKGKNAIKQPSRNQPLSDKEAEKLRPMLLSALMDYFGYADELLYATVKGHPHVVIWGDIDDEEAGILVDAMLSSGRKSSKVAARIVAMVDTHRNLKIGLILAPRFYKTFQMYLQNGVSIK